MGDADVQDRRLRSEEFPRTAGAAHRSEGLVTPALSESLLNVGALVGFINWSLAAERPVLAQKLLRGLADEVAQARSLAAEATLSRLRLPAEVPLERLADHFREEGVTRLDAVEAARWLRSSGIDAGAEGDRPARTSRS